MKKLITLTLILLFVSCETLTENTYYIKYEVHYASRIDTLEFTGSFREYPCVHSSRGTNSIYYSNNERNWNSLIESSAPINIIEVKQLTTKN